MFTPFDQKKTMPEVEDEVLSFWREKEVFKKSLEQRKDKEPFVFYEGPPTANGRPGIHHILSRTFKDIICRYQTMKGRFVLRKAGWDTHGLPVELQVEKALGLKNKTDIEAFGVAKFNEECRKSVWEYQEEWEKLTERIGYWEDLKSPYITYDPNYIESVWYGLKQVWDKGYIYKDYKVVPYCSRCGTALSLAEVAQGYKDVTETSVYIKFALNDESNAYILAWTTTPWTLPGNVGLAVGSEIPYVQVKQDNETYYLAKDRLSVLKGEYEVVRELTGKDLIGKTYKPLFDFLDLGKVSGKTGYRVLDADFVTTVDGTGVVHTAVMYGEEDFNLGKKEDLPSVHTVNEKGEFNELVPLWQGRFVKDTEKEIIEFLKERNSLYKTEQTKHTYPFCWRCSTPLLYYARSSWFIKVDQPLRDRLVELNQTIKWVPDHVKNGRFGNWLEGLRDWAISRERYWGTPLPIWICEDDESHKVMVGSYEELRQLAKDPSHVGESFDPHKPFIDEVDLACPDCQGTMHRVPEVLDVWIDSGSMPFAQWHYPFENKEMFESQFPADYIAEGIDQTRGWFNSMLILATLIFDEKAYKSVITPNLVLDEKGQKMSKSKGNVVNPWEAVEKTGVDAVRFFFLSVNRPGDNKSYSDRAVMEVYRKTVMIWWNVVNFFLTYAAVDKWQPGDNGTPTVMDKWIVALANKTTEKIDLALTDLDTFTAARTLTDFIDDLSTWYLRRSRKRRDAAFYSTLHTVLLQTSRLAAPFMPFVSEATYRALKTEDMPESVHLTDYPEASETDEVLLEAMAQTRQMVTLGHAARVQGKMKLRQPLASAVLVGSTERLYEGMEEILAEELNVKAVSVRTEAPEGWLLSDGGVYTIALDPNLTDELKREGIFRELVRELQDARKKAGCKPGELVDFQLHTEQPLINDILQNSAAELRAEVSARQIVAATPVENANYTSETTIDESILKVGLVHAR